MSGATDSGMVKIMGIVMACLTVFALVCVFAARLLGLGSDDASDPLMRNALVQRIQPIAAVRTSADDLAAADTVASATADAPKSGEELVNGACAACHIAGVAGAPMLGDEAAWAERRELGLDALVASVINGKGSMPARGGSTYSDDEIRLAVQTMALFEVDESAAAPAAEDAATDAGAEDTAAAASAEDSAAAPAAEETAVVPAAEDSAAAPAAEETAVVPAAEDSAAAPATEETAVAPAVEDTAAAPAAEETATAVPEEAVAALVVGAVPEGLTDNIKSNVDGICISCHLAGVAGAPKNGDKVAWQERADKGLAALTSSVINGLNVMPPRGGSALSDEEIPIAIQYLMSK